MIEPTVGRVVWFWPIGPAANANEQPAAAIIAHVHHERLVDLYVMPGGRGAGPSYLAEFILLVQDDEDRERLSEGSAYCEWMPFQKGQAPKVDELKELRSFVNGFTMGVDSRFTELTQRIFTLEQSLKDPR